MNNLTLLFIGWGIGFISSVIGALLQYRFFIKRGRNARLPNVIFPVTGILGLIGCAAIMISLFTESLTESVIIGIGVVTGFFVGFFFMIVLRILLQRRKEVGENII